MSIRKNENKKIEIASRFSEKTPSEIAVFGQRVETIGMIIRRVVNDRKQLQTYQYGRHRSIRCRMALGRIYTGR